MQLLLSILLLFSNKSDVCLVDTSLNSEYYFCPYWHLIIKYWAPEEQRDSDSVKSLCKTKGNVWSQNEEWSGRGNYLDKLAHVQVLINCQYSIAQMCTLEDMFAHYLGTLYLDDVLSQNELTTAINKKKIALFSLKMFHNISLFWVGLEFPGSLVTSLVASSS